MDPNESVVCRRKWNLLFSHMKYVKFGKEKKKKTKK